MGKFVYPRSTGDWSVYYLVMNMNDKEIASELKGIAAFDGMIYNGFLTEKDVDAIVEQMMEILLDKKVVTKKKE